MCKWWNAEVRYVQKQQMELSWVSGETLTNKYTQPMHEIEGFGTIDTISSCPSFMDLIAVNGYPSLSTAVQIYITNLD